VTFPFLKEKIPSLLRLIGSIPIPRVDCWQNSVTRKRICDTPKIRILLPKVPKWQPSAVDWMMSPFSGFARRHCHWKRPLWPNWLIRPHYIEDIQKILIPRLHPGSFNQFQHEKGYLNVLRRRWHLKKVWVAVSFPMEIAPRSLQETTTARDDGESRRANERGNEAPLASPKAPWWASNRSR